jgi:transcriptional regulator with XRE-family HTH domain
VNKIKIRGIDGVDAELIREAVDTAGELLASRLRTARESAGFSQEDVEEALGISDSVLSNYERGVRMPGLLRAVALAALYGVTLEWLVWDEEDRTK